MTIDETNPEAPRPRGGPRGSYAKSTATRNAILEAALEVFAQGGYRAGSLREVAARVEMSEAGLLHHFPSKSVLLAAVLARRDEHSYELVHFEETGADPMETLGGLVRLAAYNASVPGVVELYCVLSAEATAPSHPAHAYFVERYATTQLRIARTFAALAERGGLQPGVEPGAAARSVIALMDGLQVQWLLDRASVDMAAELRNHLARLVTEPIS
ncbi:TetR/AcrR family transcriptional regulator [Pseudolysinimonas sp.]|uniref:TetR/AcrR family transcriptional regulator n=1 Tax=Pseudolysinimonas sp. TaxID=2680009 RepID=UPI00286AF5B0|nr:TetR/AcrR family transcriptional regulator [Pseudolysinimonas sp.]